MHVSGFVMKPQQLAVACPLMLAASMVIAGDEPLATLAREPESAICSSDLAFQKEGLKESAGRSVRDRAVSRPGAGGLCAAREFEVTKPLKIYRVSGSTTPDYYNWWTFDEPTGSASEYRSRNVMCAEWSVKMQTSCTLRAGTRIAVGYGQSLKGCGGPSTTIQVFLAGDRSAVKESMEKDSCHVEPSRLQP